MWTKLGDEFSDVARDLSDAAYRTLTEAWQWSNRRGLDLMIPKRDLLRFAESNDRDKAVVELIDTGWWQDMPDDDCWYVGCRYSEWQLDKAVVDARRQQSATRSRRYRRHRADIHDLCVGRSCYTPVTRDVTSRSSSAPLETQSVTRDAMRDDVDQDDFTWGNGTVTRDAMRDDMRDVTRTVGSGRVGVVTTEVTTKTSLEAKDEKSFVGAYERETCPECNRVSTLPLMSTGRCHRCQYRLAS